MATWAAEEEDITYEDPRDIKLVGIALPYWIGSKTIVSQIASMELKLVRLESVTCEL